MLKKKKKKKKKNSSVLLKCRLYAGLSLVYCDRASSTVRVLKISVLSKEEEKFETVLNGLWSPWYPTSQPSSQTIKVGRDSHGSPMALYRTYVLVSLSYSSFCHYLGQWNLAPFVTAWIDDHDHYYYVYAIACAFFVKKESTENRKMVLWWWKNFGGIFKQRQTRTRRTDRPI